jgi:heme exporter protein B
MKGVAAAFSRELKLAWSGGGGAALPVGFFAGAATLTPFAVGADAETLRIAGPGVLWIALALSSLLPMERLFQADLEDGTLDAYAGSGVVLEAIVLAKTLAHWIAVGVPLSLIAPVLWIMLHGEPGLSHLVVMSSLAGSLAFFFFGSIGAALAAGVRRGGLLIALVALPLYVPTMIFGASGFAAAAAEVSWGPSLGLTAAAALFGAALSPFAGAMALRAAID